MVCSEWPPVATPIFTTATPISCWMVDCTAWTCRTTSLTFPRPASVHSMLLKVCWHLPTQPVLALLMIFIRVLLPCFSLLHANDSVWHSEAVAAGCVLQKLRCSIVYGRSNFLPLQKSRRKAWHTYIQTAQVSYGLGGARSGSPQ